MKLRQRGGPQLCEAAKGSGDGELQAGGDGRFGGRRHGLTVTAIHYGQIQSRPSWRTGGGRFCIAHRAESFTVVRSHVHVSDLWDHGQTEDKLLSTVF